MLTNDDIKKLKDVFATKSDLKRTNDTVEEIKGDVKQLKGDVKELQSDVKQLQGAVSNIAVEVVGLKQEVADIRENMATKDDFRQVMTTMDAVLGEVKAMREGQSSHFQQHEDNDKFHKTINKRVQVIETVPVIAHQIKKKN